MRKPTNFSKAFPDQSNPNTDEESEEMEDWRDENGQPSEQFLRDLVENDGEEAMEKLRDIAEDLDIEYEDDTSADELIDRILSSEFNDPRETA